jgi:hypothetical protein
VWSMWYPIHPYEPSASNPKIQYIFLLEFMIN